MTTTTTTTIHAFFSADTALVLGSSVFRKPDGSTVNVTRVSPERRDPGSYHQDENYLGEVVRAEDGGRVGANLRVDGITSVLMRRFAPSAVPGESLDHSPAAAAAAPVVAEPATR
jgi:hypothetical protein